MQLGHWVYSLQNREVSLVQNSLNVTFRKMPTAKRLAVRRDANEWLMKLRLPNALADSNERLPPP